MDGAASDMKTDMAGMDFWDRVGVLGILLTGDLICAESRTASRHCWNDGVIVQFTPEKLMLPKLFRLIWW
jgi:hypothetical protein